MKIASDDEVYRVRTVWLGPTGLTFPWTARYLAYGTWLATFLLILLVEAITPLSVRIPPVWEISLATLFTYGLLTFVDHERPIGSIWRTFIVDLSSPRHAKTLVISYRPPRVREYVWAGGKPRKVVG